MSKIIVVTGANRGIGLEIVRQLANSKKSDEYKIIGTFRSEKDLDSAVKSLGEKASKVKFQQLDVSSADSIKAFVESFKAEEKIDTLVNNAGLNKKNSELTVEVAKQVFGVNYYGLKHITLGLLPKIDKENGRIINVTSGLGAINSKYSEEKRKLLLATKSEKDIDELAKDYIQSIEDGTIEKSGWRTEFAGYAMSKVFANRFGIVLAHEQPHLFVANVCPGWVKTRMGGEKAKLDVKDGADGIVWLIEEDVEKIGESGKFWRHRKQIDYVE